MTPLPFVVEENKPLDTCNTLGLTSIARYFVEASSQSHILEALAFAKHRNLETLVLGGGSNVILAPTLNYLVISILNKGIKVEGNNVIVSAGENWHQLVRTTIKEGLFGLENLSLIPGSAGAAPIQNIGAYGVEIDSVISAVTVIDRESLAVKTLDAGQCEFGYRTSIFKASLRNKVIVTGIKLMLKREFVPQLKYLEMREALEQINNGKHITRPENLLEGELTALDVSDMVMRIRRRKLPDPEKIGNVGSFFKNPIVSSLQYAELCAKEPAINGLPIAGNNIKLSAAWMIDQAGLKGERVGGAMVSAQHALVLINEDHASFDDIQRLSTLVIGRIHDRFGVDLEVEPITYQ